MGKFGRVLTAMVTPFGSDLEVNYKQAAELAKQLAAHGSDGIVVGATTGEAPALTDDEKLKLFETVLEAVGNDAFVIAYTGTNVTAHSIELTKKAEKLGVHGLLVVGPYYNKPTQEGLYRHFKAIAESTSLPIILYNVPGRTSSNILPATVARLAEIPNIVGLKEACGVLDQVSEVRRLTPPDFTIYSGDDSLTLPMLAVGCQGVISVASNLPLAGDMIQEMIQAYFAGEVKKAAEMHLKLMPLFKGLFIVTNPIPVKAALNLSGINVGGLRLPLVEANENEKAIIKPILQDLNLIS